MVSRSERWGLAAGAGGLGAGAAVHHRPPARKAWGSVRVLRESRPDLRPVVFQDLLQAAYFRLNPEDLELPGLEGADLERVERLADDWLAAGHRLVAELLRGEVAELGAGAGRSR